MAMQSHSKSNKGKVEKPAVPPAKVAAKPAPVKAREVYAPTREEIQNRAFEIYVSEGCRDGNDLENWLRAEKELRAQGSR